MSFLTERLSRPSSEKPYMLIVAGHPAEDAEIPNHAMIKKPLGDILTVF